MGKGTFEKLNSIFRIKTSPSWKEVGYFVFDLPASELPFEKRMEQLESIRLPSHVHKVEHFKCTGKNHLEKFLEEIMTEGGEGVMARKPNSRYIAGRTSNLLKIKVSIQKKKHYFRMYLIS